MQLVRTTLRLKPSLKKAAERHALDQDSSMQEIFNRALEDYLIRKRKDKAKKIVFKTHDLQAPLNNLPRSYYYSDGQM